MFKWFKKKNAVSISISFSPPNTFAAMLREKQTKGDKKITLVALHVSLDMCTLCMTEGHIKY